MSHLADIGKYYKVPAKRGQTVRYRMTKNIYHTGRITAASRHGYCLNVWLIDANIRITVHPFDLDYLIDEEWVTGDSLLDKFNARIAAWNRALNAPKGSTS
jgi:hypothetical protein